MCRKAETGRERLLPVDEAQLRDLSLELHTQRHEAYESQARA